MSRLVKFGLIGLFLVVIISIITWLSAGSAVYTAPLAIPFTVMILIGISRHKS